jgi:hypothetical protein
MMSEVMALAIVSILFLPGTPNFLRNTSREKYPAVEVAEHQRYINASTSTFIY